MRGGVGRHFDLSSLTRSFVPWQESIETMRTRLERSIQMLTLLRAFEARDRNLQEDNLERVNFWSAANVAVLLLVAVLQVCTLKRFFHDKRPVPT